MTNGHHFKNDKARPSGSKSSVSNKHSEPRTSANAVNATPPKEASAPSRTSRGSKPQVTTNVQSSWLLRSVQEFFSNCNWQGQPLVETPSGKQADPATLLTLSVAEFFKVLPWEGTPEVGSLPKPAPVPEVSASQTEVTLSDLLDLF